MTTDIPSLCDICSSSIATSLFRNNIRWRRLTDVAFQFRDSFNDPKIPRTIKNLIKESIANVLGEVRRWDSKHSEMFVDSKSKRRVFAKSEHLRTFYEHLIWKKYKCEIDDVATCCHLIQTELHNWPLMQFQFACLYAKTEIIFDDWKFDKYRRATFKKQLSDHPVYDFWLTLMESRPNVFFDTERRLPNQKLMQCFIFAIRNGFQQLVEFIWNRITDRHREAMGLLEWRSMCFKARDGNTMQFLCKNLCRMNPNGTCRIAWNAFFDSFYHMINDEKSDIVVQNQFLKKFEFLFKNSCPILRSRILKMDNCRFICDAFRYNYQDIFGMLLHYMDPSDVAYAREYIDRIFDRKKTCSGEKLRKALLRRQFTIE